jgi:serine/threonine protein kinase
MGEVYLADDLSLDRRVALKFIPDMFAGDSERMARFEREAKLLASLNHPNIAAIYGLEQAEGKRFIVMEFAEGETLAQRLSKGALPVDEVLGICRQIAEGLDAAHEKGVVHRDLKPANVMITEGERVKILDFGLAKALADETQSVDSSQSPTLTEAMTRPGVILGTAAYMSPEQAKGKTADRRADIWAYGCILYECLTGKRAFEGETVTEMLAAILKEEPNWDALPAATPPNIRSILHRCLEKDPKRRLRDIGDVIFESEPAAFVAPERQPVWKHPLVWALILAATASLVYALWKQPSSAPKTVARVAIPLPPDQTVAGYPAISPDGQTIAYIAQKGTEEPQLYLRSLNSFQSRPVIGSSGAEQPFFSPDGKWIAFFAQGRLLKSEVAGGSPVQLCDAASPVGGTWNEDGTIIFTSGLGSGLLRVPAVGGTPESLTKPDGAGQGYGHVWPQSLPGGESILFTVWGLKGGTAILSLESRRWQFISEGTGSGGIPCLPSDSTGYLVVAFPGGVRAAPFDPAHPERTGPESFKSILEKIYYTDSDARLWLSVSKNGTAVYVQGNPERRSLVWVDRDGKEEPFTGEPGNYSELALVADRSQVLVTQAPDIWLYDLKRPGSRTRMVLGGTPGNNNGNSVWSRDGKHIFFASNRGGDWDIYSQPADGSLPAEVLLKRPYDQFPFSAGPDGSLFFTELHPKTGGDIWALSPEGKPVPVRVTPFNEWGGSLSPDGRWVAYDSNESGRYESYILDYPGCKKKVSVSSGGGSYPRWSHTGDELFFLAGNALMAVRVHPDGSLASTPHRLFDSSEYLAYDVSPDGKRFLMIQNDPDWAPHQLNVIFNWFEELRQKVPVK